MTAKVVVVTGASSGIGEATARRYGALGAHVLLIARNAERLSCAAEAIRRAGGKADIFPVDLADTKATAEVIARIKRETGTPDILINNAGAGRWLPFLETSPEEARSMMAVPYFASFDLTRGFMPEMIARGSGSVAFVTSPASYVSWPNASAYIAARRALAGFAEGLQAEFKGKGVLVTIVVLGMVESAYWEHNPGSRERTPKISSRLAPALTPGEAAEAIINGVAGNKQFVMKPSILRMLFVLNALFPRIVARELRRAAKRSR